MCLNQVRVRYSTELMFRHFLAAVDMEMKENLKIISTVSDYLGNIFYLFWIEANSLQ